MFVDDELLLDDNAKPCAFKTRAKVLTDSGGNPQTRLGQTDMEIDMINKTNLPDQEEKPVPFNEEFLFLRNIPGLILMKQGKLDIVLALQLVEAEYNQENNKTYLPDKSYLPDKTGDPEGSHVSEEGEKPALDTHYKDLDESIEPSDYQPTGWFSMKLNNPDGTIKYGQYTEQLLLPPALKPPFEPEQVQKTPMALTFIIEELVYDAAMLEKIKKEKKKKKKKPKKLDISKKKVPKEIHLQLDERPFIVNTKKQYEDRPFEKGNGIDFYIDGARFLPDNVTVTKVILS